MKQVAVENKIDVLIVRYGLFWPDLRVVTGELDGALELALDVACKLLINLNDFHWAFWKSCQERSSVRFGHDAVI